MKNPLASPLILLTLTLAVLLIGFLIGSSRSSSIQVSVPDSMLTLPTQSVVPTTAAIAQPTTEPTTPATEEAEYVSFPLNINVSSKEDFMLLPGIGEKLAQQIVNYRKKNGRFSSIEELTKVPGIGSALLEQIRDQITVGG